MGCQIVVGAQWGDEGKGKIVDLLCEHADVVARYQGGANAGHTVVVGDTTVILHLLPSGVLRPGIRCLLGNGVVIDPRAFFAEVEQVESAGFPLEGRLGVSPAAHVTMPYHRWLEQVEEAALGEKRIGTAGRAIGPTYRDKSGRSGIRISDLLHPVRLRDRLEARFASLRGPANERPTEFSVDALLDEFTAYGKRLAPFVTDVSLELHTALARGKNVLLEGAQGTMLDLDHGTYPFVTGSSAVAGGALVGVGLGPTKVGTVIGVAKAYCTRVGNGPFPTELAQGLGDHLREVGAEYGATTGRARRCGWYDAPAMRHAARVNGLEVMAVTKLDVLDGISPLRICRAYKVDGREMCEMPVDMEDFECAEPVYEDWEGWGESTTAARRWEDLPLNAQRYLDRLAGITGVPICLVSVGSERDSTLWLRDVRMPGR
ncbi:MAG: adenylosuccinate synthase [Candidatus Eisenbacteria bacterium]|nr:adenylosuccinate synthase [Candidatus Eisenbacteria bacterium]